MPRLLRVRDVSLKIGKGEIAGLAGLLGSGRTETARLIYAADRKDKGSIKVAGVERTIPSPPTPSATASASSPRTARSRASFPR